MPKIVRVTSAQKRAAQTVVKRAEEKGETLPSAYYKVANAERRQDIDDSYDIDRDYEEFKRIRHELAEKRRTDPNKKSIPPNILAKDLKVGDKLLSWGTVVEITTIRVAHFDTNAMITLHNPEQPYVKG